MTIAVIGAGAIGSLVAGYLTKAGKQVTLIGREDQVAAIARHGLIIKTVTGNEVIRVEVKTKLDREYDLVIFAVKTQDLESAYQENCDYLERSLILTSQNGVQADTILSAHFEKDLMLSSIVMFGATYTRSGEVTDNFAGPWIIGRPFLPVNPTVHVVADELRSAFPVTVSTDIMGMKWLKLFVNFNNCIPALTGTSMQETFTDMDFCRLSIMLLREGVDIVGKANIALVSLPDFPVERIRGLVTMPVEQAASIMQKVLTGLSKEPLYGSILQSIMRGRTSEIDFINGEVVWMAKQMGMTAPLNEKIVDMVHDVERTGKFFSSEDIKSAFNL